MYYYQSPLLKQERGLRGNKRHPLEDAYGSPATDRYRSSYHGARAASLDTPTSSSYLSPTSTSNNYSRNSKSFFSSQPAASGATGNKTNSQGESISGMLNNFSKALGKSATNNLSLLAVRCGHSHGIWVMSLVRPPNDPCDEHKLALLSLLLNIRKSSQ